MDLNSDNLESIILDKLDKFLTDKVEIEEILTAQQNKVIELFEKHKLELESSLIDHQSQLENSLTDHQNSILSLNNKNKLDVISLHCKQLKEIENINSLAAQRLENRILDKLYKRQTRFFYIFSTAFIVVVGTLILIK